MPSRRPRSRPSLRARLADTHCPPEPSPRRRTCGSHVVHDQASSRPGSQKTPMVRSAGPQWTAAWQTQAAGHRQRALALADDADDAGAGEVDLDRGGGHVGRRDDLLDRAVEPRTGLALHRRGPRHVADTGVQRQEVAGARAPLPQPGRRQGRTAQCGRRVGDVVAAAGPLGGRGLPEVVAQGVLGRGEAQVLLRHVLPAATLLLPPGAHAEHRAERGEQRVLGAVHDHDHDRGQDQRSDDGGEAEAGGRRRVLAHRRLDRLRRGRPPGARRPVERRGAGGGQVVQRAGSRGRGLGEVAAQRDRRTAGDDDRLVRDQDALLAGPPRRRRACRWSSRRPAPGRRPPRARRSRGSTRRWASRG